MANVQIQRIGTHDLPKPEFASLGAAGIDIRSSQEVTLWPGEEAMVGTGFAWAIPEGWGGLLLPRSGMGASRGLVLGNLVGLIDSDYRGELKVALWYRRDEGPPITVTIGQRIAQLALCRISSDNVMWSTQEVDDLPPTPRQAGGFGSTGDE